MNIGRFLHSFPFSKKIYEIFHHISVLRYPFDQARFKKKIKKNFALQD